MLRARVYLILALAVTLALAPATTTAFEGRPHSGGGFGLDALSALLSGKSKVDVGFGGYAVSARTETASGSTAGVGLYQFNFRRSITARLEATIGYTIYFSRVFSGDSGAGLDIGVNYFPFSQASDVSAALGGQVLRIEETFRPYVGVSFNQRHYQSIQAAYNGVGLLLGAEHSLRGSLSLNGVLRAIRLTGGSGVTATELGGVLGVSVRF